MNRRRRRRTTGRSYRYYSLDDLLVRQPKSLRKNPEYPRMLNHFLSSEKLLRLRISSRCFQLLNKAGIDPEHLEHFYRTYRVPKDPFFPLFLRIKRNYLLDRQKKMELRESYILEKMKKLPPKKLRYIRFLAEWEQELNRKSDYPFWMENLYPKTKKQVHRYEAYSFLEWDAFFRQYVYGLLVHYRRNPETLGEKVLACGVLDLLPGTDPLILPGRGEVLHSFRTLSRTYHPDRGGSTDIFIKLKDAREVLC